MMTLLRGLHAIAAQRGDGLRPELFEAALSAPESVDIEQAPRPSGHDTKPCILIAALICSDPQKLDRS